MSKEHHVIMSPGMDGRIGGIQFVTKNWPEKYGLHPEVVQTVWKDGLGLEPKLSKILALIDSLSNGGKAVSLVGTIASGSLMLNAFAERRDIVNKVVNVGGFLRRGHGTGMHSFETRSVASKAFRESVLRFERLEPSLTEEDRKKILTVRPLLGDELVPAHTVTVDGALNKTVPMGEHILGIATALVLYNPVIAFLKEQQF